MQILSIFIVIGAFYFALKYPPYTLCLYMIFSSPESYSIGSYFLNQYASPLISGAALVASVTSFYRLFKKKNSDRSAKRIFYLATLCIFISFWVWFSTIVNLRNYWQSIVDISEAGAFGCIIVFSYYPEKRAQLAFIVTVLFHIFFSFIIYFFPGTYFIDFITISHLATSDISMLHFYGVTSEALYRISAHFANSIQLGFYGAVGLILGSHLLTVPKRWIRSLGIILLGISFWVNYATVVRSLWIFFFIGYFYSIGKIRQRQLPSSILRYKKKKLLIFSIILLMFSLVFIYIGILQDNHLYNKSYYSLFNFFSDILSSSYQGYKYRVTNLFSSADIIIKHPLFGLGSVEAIVKSKGGMSHLIMVAFGAMYGVPVFVAVTILFIILIKSIYIYIKKPLSMSVSTYFHIRYAHLVFMFGVIVFAIGLSNHSAGRMLQWICLALGCLPWVYSKNTDYRVKW